MRIIPIMTKKEPTYQVVFDALALSPLYPAFLITAEVPEIYMQQFWHTITKIKDYSSYQFKLDKKKGRVDVEELGYKGDIESITEKTTGLDKIRLSRTQILWGMFYNQNVDYVELLWDDFMFQIDNRNTSATRKDNMPYPRFTKAIIQHFISKDKTISMRNKRFMHTVEDDTLLGSLKVVSKTKEYQAYGALIPAEITNLKMQNSHAYKTYLAFATRAATPKKARKFKKLVSPSKKKTLVAVEEPIKKPAKKHAARRQSTGVQIRDTLGVSVSKKKAPTKAKRNKGIDLLSEAALLEEAHEGADLESEVPDEPKGKSIDISEGIGLKPGVPNVSKADSFESEYESWGDSNDDNDDDDQQSNDEQALSDNPRTSDDKEETQEDEYVHTPEDYVPTDDETNDVDDEEYDRINKKMYSDVNVELKDTKLEGEGKDDEETTNVGHVDAEHENVNQEIAGDQVKDVARTIVQHENPSNVTISTTNAPSSTTLTAIHQRLFDLENEVKTLRHVDHSSVIHAATKSEVPTVVKEYLGTSLDDALYKVIQRHTTELIKEQSVLADVVEILQQQQKPQLSADDIHKIKIEQVGK
ncbi:hypothetical protein Tco_0034126 [Tanacetum coccineum]